MLANFAEEIATLTVGEAEFYELSGIDYAVSGDLITIAGL